MARRRKQSSLEDLLDLAATLPWWIPQPLGNSQFAILLN